jgi:hypothetical protein
MANIVELSFKINYFLILSCIRKQIFDIPPIWNIYSLDLIYKN